MCRCIFFFLVSRLNCQHVQTILKDIIKYIQIFQCPIEMFYGMWAAACQRQKKCAEIHALVVYDDIVKAILPQEEDVDISVTNLQDAKEKGHILDYALLDFTI